MKDRIFLLILLGFLASCVFDVACPRHAEAQVVPENDGAHWVLHIRPHPDNVLIEQMTICYSGTKMVYRSVDSHPVQPEEARVELRKSGPVPRGTDCRVSWDVMRNAKHDEDPTNNRSAEGASLGWKEP